MWKIEGKNAKKNHTSEELQYIDTKNFINCKNRKLKIKKQLKIVLTECNLIVSLTIFQFIMFMNQLQINRVKLKPKQTHRIYILQKIIY